MKTILIIRNCFPYFLWCFGSLTSNTTIKPNESLYSKNNDTEASGKT
jgi:hypothetical protein